MVAEPPLIHVEHLSKTYADAVLFGHRAETGRRAVDLMALDTKQVRKFRDHIQIVLQNSYTLLNPRMTVRQIVEEPLRIHEIVETEDVVDELATALDVSVRAQILNLLRDLQDQLGFSYLFISYDIAVVENMADRVGRLSRRQLVEVGEVGTFHACRTIGDRRR